MTNSKHVPKRRFKEFESDNNWEEQTLTDFIKLYNGLTYSPNDVRKNGTLVLRSSNIQSGEIINADNVYVSSDKATSENVRSGDIIVVVRNGSRSLIGKHAMVKGEMPNTVIGAFMSGMHSEHSTFVNALLDTPKFGKEIEKNMGATINQITGAMFSKMNFKIPSGIEQDYIGTFFYSIDSLITLHQHKLDKLKNLKKAYLAELFPADGERVPKRRFPGFEGEWEEKKLASIASMHARIGWQNLRTSEFLDDGDYYLITGTDFLDGHINFDKCHYVDEKRFQQDKNIQVVNGSILITKDGTLGKVAIVNNLDKPATLNAGVFNVVVKDPNIDVKYLYQYLAAPYLMNYVSKRATGGTIKHLNQNILVDFPIYFPEYKEQKTIGNFLEKLDKSISLQQQKLDKLKDLKKAYLNELFV